jgi:hypothetical protein
MGVDTSLEVSWCGTDSPDSRVRRSVSSADGPTFYSWTVYRTFRELHNCCFIFCFCGRLLFLNGLWSPSLFVVAGTVDVCH